MVTSLDLAFLFFVLLQLSIANAKIIFTTFILVSVECGPLSFDESSSYKIKGEKNLIGSALLWITGVSSMSLLIHQILLEALDDGAKEGGWAITHCVP